MKWKQRQIHQKKLTQIILNNGNRLSVRETPNWKLQTLYDKAGEWVKSKLRYFKGRQVIKELVSEAKAQEK